MATNEGRRVASVRALLGMTQTEFAKKCGVSQTTVWMVEHGKYQASREFLNGMAAIGINTLYILGKSNVAIEEEVKR